MMQVWEQAFRMGIYGFFVLSGFACMVVLAFGIVGMIGTIITAIAERVKKQ